MPVSRTNILLFCVAVLLLAVASGCETMPVQEMSDARQAITAARDAGAETHAADVLQAAESSLARAQQNLNARDYDKARQDALDAKSKAIDALRRSEASRAAER